MSIVQLALLSQSTLAHMYSFVGELMPNSFHSWVLSTTVEFLPKRKSDITNKGQNNQPFLEANKITIKCNNTYTNSIYDLTIVFQNCNNQEGRNALFSTCPNIVRPALKRNLRHIQKRAGYSSWKWLLPIKFPCATGWHACRVCQESLPPSHGISLSFCWVQTFLLCHRP